jgi:hypothetical protein
MMSNLFNKKLSVILSKMDDKMTQTKLNAALDMLKNGNTDDLAKKIGKMDKDELLTKINEFDTSKLKDLNININDIKQKVNEADLNKLSSLIGDKGDEIVKKLKDILNK